LRALCYLDLEDMTKALDDLTYIIQQYPSSVAYYNRAMTYTGLADYENAMQDFNSAIECNTYQYAPIYYGRSHVRYVLQDLSGAKTDYQKAQAIDPGKVDNLEDTFGMYVRGLSLVQFGDRTLNFIGNSTSLQINTRILFNCSKCSLLPF
jgi:tetratricopeptide (TPR) repeat protein